jgi:hypothetical protein
MTHTFGGGKHWCRNVDKVLESGYRGEVGMPGSESPFVSAPQLLLEMLEKRPGSEEGLLQRLGRGAVHANVRETLRRLGADGLVVRLQVSERESAFDEFVITDLGRSLLGEIRLANAPFHFPLSDTVESAPPDLQAETLAVLADVLDGAELSVAELTARANENRAVSWITEAGVFEVLRANPEVFREIIPGVWTGRIEPGAQGAPVAVRRRPPSLSEGAEAELDFGPDLVALVA